jgi:hypothetical protein
MKNQLDMPLELAPTVTPLAPFNAAVNAAVTAANAAVNPAVTAAVASSFKAEDRRQNTSYFANKPVTQTIPVKLPDNIIELLKGQARQRGVSLQTLIKSTLAASVSASIVEEQS